MSTSNPNRHNTRPVIIDALRHAAATFAGHRGLVFLLRSIKYFLAGIVFLGLADALFHFTSGSRFGLLLGAAGVGIALFSIAIAIGFLARPALGKIALLLEHRDLSLGSKLTNVLELDAQSKDEKLPALTRELAQRAVEDSAQQVDASALPATARAPRIPRELKWAFTPFFLIALLIFLLGEPARRQLLRYLDPYGDHPPLSFTRLEISKPDKNGSEVVFGEGIRIEARARGHKPKDLVLLAQPLDDSQPARELPMTTRGDGSYAVALDNVRQPLKLAAATGNGRSRSKFRELGVILNPTIEQAWARITPPSYTGQTSKEKPFRFTGLQALEGSTVEFRVRSNRPLGEGWVLASLGDEELEKVELRPAPGGPANEAVASMVPTESGRVVFDVRDVDSREADHKPASSLTITRDLPPQISLLSPAEDSFVLDALNFERVVQASDDYGLRRLRIFIGINDDYDAPRVLEFDGIGPRRHNQRDEMSLIALGVQPGDIISIYAEATDNCPTPHVARTDIRRLEVISEEQYNEFLRKRSDVAQIAGKYEQLLGKLQDAIERQRELTQKLEDLKTKAREDGLTEGEQKELEQLASEQAEINEDLTELAEEMKNFGRENPVYDFEVELQNNMRELGERIEQSVQQNAEDMRQAGAPQQPPPPQNEEERREDGEENQPGEGEENQPGEGEENQPGKGEGNQPGEGEGDQPGEGEGNQLGEGEGNQPGEGEGNRPGEGGGEPNPKGMDRAAREHLERLGGEQQRGQEDIQEPLEDLADLHELMKNFNQFRQLFEAQRQLAEQTKPYKEKDNLDQADRLSLREMAARQRQLGMQLGELRKSLEENARAAQDEFPQAAQSAQDLADAIGVAAMPGLARASSQSMLKGDGPRSHHRAENLKDEMANLFSAGGQNQGGGAAQAGLDRYLQLNRGMNPGNSFNQMMQSLNFSPGQGGPGAGSMGPMAMSGQEGKPQGLMGSESMLAGPIAGRIAGRGARHQSGLPGGGSAPVDRVTEERTASNSTRETETPQSEAFLPEYESLTDAYFRFLTKPPSE